MLKLGTSSRPGNCKAGYDCLSACFFVSLLILTVCLLISLLVSLVVCLVLAHLHPRLSSLPRHPRRHHRPPPSSCRAHPACSQNRPARVQPVPLALVQYQFQVQYQLRCSTSSRDGTSFRGRARPAVAATHKSWHPRAHTSHQRVATPSMHPGMQLGALVSQQKLQRLP